MATLAENKKTIQPRLRALRSKHWHQVGAAEDIKIFKAKGIGNGGDEAPGAEGSKQEVGSA